MNLNFLNLLSRMPSACAQGILWGLMALGVYITFRVLDIADLSVDGTFATGGAVTVMLIIGGCPAGLALLVALLAGMYGPPAHQAWHPGYPVGNPDPVCTLFHQPAYHGHEGQPDRQPEKVRHVF